MTANRFTQAYRQLESCFKQQVESESSIYLPAISPPGCVDFVLIGMEPSLGHWARTKEEARAKIRLGFKDFAFSVGDFILHYCIRQYLCYDDSTYHITNVSKGAMRTCEADTDRLERYNRWYPLLSEELKIISKETTKIIAIGQAVKRFLDGQGLKDVHKTILHYSNQAARYRSRYVQGRDREQEFQKFKAEVPIIVDGILKVVDAVIEEARMPEAFVSQSVRNLRKDKKLTPSQEKLIFGYKIDFKGVKEMAT